LGCPRAHSQVWHLTIPDKLILCDGALKTAGKSLHKFELMLNLMAVGGQACLGELFVH
jgi:fumarate hydratase class II